MKILNTKLLTTLVVACLALPAVSVAGEFCEYGKGGMMGGGMMDREAMHKELHDQLKLTADQEVAWKTFTDTMMPAKSMMGDMSTDWDKLTTPQRADKMLEFSKMHEQQMEMHVAAMKTFYATLTPAQQKIFDDFHTNRKPMMQNRMDNKDMPMKDMSVKDKSMTK